MVIVFLIALVFLGIIILVKLGKTSEIKLGKTSEVKGERGELIVAQHIIDTKPKYAFHDYMLNIDGKTCQIDHIVINERGIFVIETKNYSGKIYGNEKQLKWKEYLAYGNAEYEFYNPVKQNATHIYNLRKILGNKYKINSIVVFIDADISHVQSDIVCNVRYLNDRLEEGDPILSDEDMDAIYNKLLNAEDVETDIKDHVKSIREEQNKIANNICPRCGGELILKEDKYGDFYGCSNYPKCKFTKHVDK